MSRKIPHVLLKVIFEKCVFSAALKILILHNFMHIVVLCNAKISKIILFSNLKYLHIANTHCHICQKLSDGMPFLSLYIYVVIMYTALR